MIPKQNTIELPYGITSFYNPKSDQPPTTDFKAFKQVCYAVAAELKTPILDIGMDGVAHNYYFSTFKNSNFALLCNAHYPFLALANDFEAPCFGQIIHGISDHKIEAIISQYDYFKLLSPEILESPLTDELMTKLAACEREQIKYWKSKTVGEVVFNFYD